VKITGNLPATLIGCLVIGSLLSIDAASADVNQMAEKCSHCHGKDGVSTEPTIPTIAGMSDFFITDNMAVYKDQARPCPETEFQDGPDKGKKTDMCKIAGELGEADTEALAKYFSGKPFVRAKQEFDPAKAEIGQKIHDHHCDKCHADGGSSAEDDAGILAGQWTPYLKQAFEEYDSGEREMPKKMKPKFEKLDAEEKEALLQYYASFQ
jgi:sulfide dehydrogenase cytochrome subunit